MVGQGRITEPFAIPVGPVQKPRFRFGVLLETRYFAGYPVAPSPPRRAGLEQLDLVTANLEFDPYLVTDMRCHLVLAIDGEDLLDAFLFEFG